MDMYISDDSPLAAYIEDKEDQLLERRQTSLRSRVDSDPPEPNPTYAPQSTPISSPQPLQTRESRSTRDRPFAGIRSCYGHLVASTLGRADNERFLEHFRYILIASQLLNETTTANPSFRQPAPSSQPQLTTTAVSFIGAALSAALSFALVCAINWTRGGPQHAFSKSRLFLVVVAFTLAGLVLYGYARRQWLKHLRQQAVSTASDLVAHAQTYEGTAVSTLALIQEVELVSRGYRLSTPLPPVSRLEADGHGRRCLRLRRTLRDAFLTTVPALQHAVHQLRPYAKNNNLERFLDAYDVRMEDVSNAMAPLPHDAEDDPGTLKYLKALHSRLSTLRRLFLCSLLAVPATGTQVDAVRWRVCVQEMEILRTVLAEQGDKIAQHLRDDDQVMQYSNLTPTKPTAPNSTRQAQTRRIGILSTSIRSIQAKLYLFQEDSTSALTSSHSETDLSSLATALRDQYDAIGADLRSLMHAWETGRQTLVDDITRQERRVSRASSSLRSSMPSIGGLTAVDEDGDGDGDSDAPTASGAMSPRSAALRKLTGGAADRPATPPVTESEDESVASRDDEVFEAVAAPLSVPRQRSALTREQRIAKMHEERERHAMLREKRDANTNMIRELQAVINLRPSGRRRNTIMGGSPAHVRLTSV